jgi:hypothetical protein
MNHWQLDQQESNNLSKMNSAGLESTLLFITETGLRKSILDATTPMRHFLGRHGIHNYREQGKGSEHKVASEVTLHSNGSQKLRITFYRAEERGDPRFWVSKLHRYVESDSVCALFVHSERLHIVNLSKGSLIGHEGYTEGMLQDYVENYPKSEIADILEASRESSSLVADELLGMLTDIAKKGPLQAECRGDTAIGRTIETALGIQANSDRRPDYKGIEIKSGRAQVMSHQTRANLFACVPNWKLSSLKSSTEIMNTYGYQRGDDFKLYCEVSCTRPNSRGLQLKIGDPDQILQEVDSRENKMVCVWELDHLHSRLMEKHKETFWVKAEAEKVGDLEFFHLKSVIHTKNPNISQFDRLLADGSITLDHLIKRGPTGRGQEKGPLFKIEKPKIQELFYGLPKKYSLVG